MIRRSTLRIRGAAVAVVLVAVGGSPVLRAAEPDRRLELQTIRQQIEGLRAELSRIDDEKAGLEAELARTDVQVRLQERQLTESKTERQLAEEAVRESEARQVELSATLERALQGLRSRLASLYRQSDRNLLRSFLSPGLGEGALEELRSVRLLARRDGFWVQRYVAAAAELADEQEMLARHRREAEQALLNEQQRLRRLGRTRSLQRRALAVMEKQRAGVEAQASVLSDKEEKLALLLEILFNQEVELPGGTAIQSFKGAVDWPVRGEILQGFGLRSEAQYRTKIPHNGVEISTRPHEPIRVVFPGVVLFASPFEDFGLTVVVHHAERVFSLYAGLGDIEVSKGDVLSFSDVLGSARDSVYFEIRVDNRPQNPLSWLR